MQPDWWNDAWGGRPSDLTTSWANLRAGLEETVLGQAVCAVNVAVWASDGVAVAMSAGTPAKIAPRRNVPDDGADWWSFIRSLRAAVPQVGEYVVESLLMVNMNGQPVLWTYPVVAAVLCEALTP